LSWKRILPLLIAVAILPAQAGEPPVGTVYLRGDLDVLPTGDLRGPLIVDFDLRNYPTVKDQLKKASRLVPQVQGERGDRVDGPEANARFDDASTAVILDIHELGAARAIGDGEWELPIRDDSDFVGVGQEDGRAVVFFYRVGTTVLGMPFRGPVRFHLPVGAQVLRWDEQARCLRYTLPTPPTEGPGKLRVSLEVRDRLMSAIYKVYGAPADFPEMWVARAVLFNHGAGPIRDVRVRFRLDQYSEWSAWTRFPLLVPGQTAVALYHPTLSPSVLQVQTDTPLPLNVEWAFDGGEGNDSAQVTIFGRNDFIWGNLRQDESFGSLQEGFNNAPFLAAWVSLNDPVVKEFSALASKLSGGVGASTGDEAGMEVLKACYDLWVGNEFVYKSPVGLTDKSASFDIQTTQNLKYPRDVIRDKSGTCIELAILYAAMAHAMGLKPYLVIIPRHCFPLVELSSGKQIPVEATGIKGGVQKEELSFEKAVEKAEEELKEHKNTGKILVVDLDAAWSRGVSNPELEELPPDILKRWGIRAHGGTGGLSPDEETGKPQTGLSGTWVGTIEHQVTPDGKTAPCAVLLTIRTDKDGGAKLFALVSAEVRDGNELVNLLIEEDLVGEVQEGQLVFQGMTKSVTRADTGEVEDLPPCRGAAELKDGKLVGTYGNDEHGFHEFTLERK